MFWACGFRILGKSTDLQQVIFISLKRLLRGWYYTRGLIQDTFALLSNLQDSTPESTKMDPVTVIQWCEEENASQKSSVVIELPVEAWTKEQISHVVKTLVSDKRVWVINVRQDCGTSRTYALIEWK